MREECIDHDWIQANMPKHRVCMLCGHEERIPPELGYTDWEEVAPYSKYRSDIVMEVHHILTEPVCPDVTIRFEIPERAGMDVIATGIGNTVDEAIDDAVKNARQRLMELKDKE